MTAPAQRSTSAWVVPVAFLALVVALAVSSVRAADSARPIVWFGLTTYLALRHRGEPWVPALYVPAATIFVLWFTQAAVGVALPFLIGLLLAYLLDPLIDRMEPRLGRSPAIAVAAVPTLLVLAGLGLLIIPSVASELEQLGQSVPRLREAIQGFYGWVIERAGGLGIQLDRDALTALAMERLESMGSAFRGAGIGIARGVQGLLDAVSFLVITPVIGFYLLRDFDRLRDVLLDHVPDDRREGVVTFLGRVDASVSGYLRGQLLVGVVMGVLYLIGLSALRMDYALVVGLSSVVLNLIPFVGSVLTAALAVAAALLTEPTWLSVAKVGALFAVIQLLDASVVSPRVMGKSLDLHPVFVMLSLLLAGRFFGIVGVILAVPAAALMKESLRIWTPQIVSLLPGVELESHSEPPQR